MEISVVQFERELNALLDAATSKETARRYLIQAENKINGYDNIPKTLQREYRMLIERTKNRLGL